MLLDITIFAAISTSVAFLAFWLSVTTDRKILISSLYVVLIIMIIVGGLYMSGKPRPYEFLFESTGKDFEVLGYKVVKDEAIYVLLDMKGWSRPFHVALPYSDKASNQLRKASREASRIRKKARVKFQKPGSRFSQGEFVFYPPKYVPPPKEVIPDENPYGEIGP